MTQTFLGRNRIVDYELAVIINDQWLSPKTYCRSRTQNNVAPATAAGIIKTFTPGISSAR